MGNIHIPNSIGKTVIETYKYTKLIRAKKKRTFNVKNPHQNQQK